MALFQLLSSILLLSLVYSAPVEVPTEAINEGQDPVPTISDIEKAVKLPINSDAFTPSREVFTSPSTEKSDLLVESNKSEPLKPSDFVSTDVVKTDPTLPQSSSDLLPLERDSNPILDPKLISQVSEDEEQQPESEKIPQQDSNPEVGPPAIDVDQQEDVDVDIKNLEPSSDQQTEGSQVTDSVPIPDSFNTERKETLDVVEEPEVLPLVTDRDEGPSNVDPPQEPFDDQLPNQTQEPFDEEEPNSGPSIYIPPQSNADSTYPEEIVREPSELPPEDDTAEQITPQNIQDFSETQNQPQNTDNVPLGSEPLQNEDKEPTEIVQPEDVGPSFEHYDDPTVESDDETRLPSPDQGDNADEGPEPFFSINADTPEEMVGDPIELPVNEDAELPAILVRSDLVPPVVPVIQMEQLPPEYGKEVIPFSDDSAKGETPEEEISNPENPEPVILNFDNRPDDGPVNIL